jgi:hypothetical protein
VTGVVAAARDLSPLARRGVLAVFASCLLLAGLAALPYVLQSRLAGEVAAQKAELALLTARASRVEARRQSLTMADQPERMFLSGATDGAALAAFQIFVNEAAAMTGMSVLRTQPLPGEETEGLRAHRLSVDASGSIEQLRAFLVAIESTLPVVIVTGFEIGPAASDAPEGEPYPSEMLSVTLRLEAYAWRGAP